MSIESNIRKILFLLLAVVLGGGLLVMLIAAINKKNHKDCTGVNITIEGQGQEQTFFLSRQEMMSLIAPDKHSMPRGKPLVAFDLKKIEAVLEQNIWVSSAQLFFDNNGVLRVNIKERVPVARIFTVSGNSFYIDSTGRQLPLSNRMTVKLPVFSSFPSDKEVLHGPDSLLLQQVKKISPFILANPFWMAQIGQIDITSARTFEMVPVIGKHLIFFGDGNDYEKKFHRLLLFYQQVGATVGLDKYSIINVAYNNEVIATRKEFTGKIDSMQAVKNVQKLIDASKQIPFDTVSTVMDNKLGITAAPGSTLTVHHLGQKNAGSDSTHTHSAGSKLITPEGRALLPHKTKQTSATVSRLQQE